MDATSLIKNNINCKLLTHARIGRSEEIKECLAKGLRSLEFFMDFQGADVEYKDPYTGRTALLNTAFGSLTENLAANIKTLLEAKANNPYESSRRDLDPLPGIMLLVESGAEINKQDNVGWTAMHYAMSFTDERRLRKTIPFLVESGFDFNKKNLKGETPLDFATARKKQGSKALYFLQNAIEANKSAAA
ncbi:Oidioi.mRNA.OKI2018_I69.chr2.g5286.t1.cds [Oikopleura dioica]|uniref:Oidioi.mRNA.OKI2018_I69.chr2.g5286.t1.cds n=1 Tax=Oikopleura dioica TaxID=34765 RepID=A0ABN7T489_OIKDI|nr:Oidioi.mRNA.OKI2018_I69.chr2.g5286.t1.cds [Oikopleura dioica]